MAWFYRILKKLPKKEVAPSELNKKGESILLKKEFIETEEIDDGPDENGEYPVLEREIVPEKIVCPDCGGITLEGLEFCDRCGGELR